jgi:hypothetical protein
VLTHGTRLQNQAPIEAMKSEVTKFDGATIRHPLHNKSKKSQAWDPSAGEISEAQENHDPGEEHD